MEPNDTDTQEPAVEGLVLSSVIDEIEGVVMYAAQKYLEAGAIDLNVFASRLSAQLIYASEVGSPKIMASIVRQVRLLAEVQRVRANDAAWDTFFEVVTTATRISVAVATKIITSGIA